MKPAIKLIISLIIPLAVGAIGGYFTSGQITTWYATLAKPSFQPPSSVFMPVWTVLYILMGISFFIVWNSHAKLEKRYTGYVYYWIQLVLNFLWSFLFFYYHRTGLALWDISLLFLFIAGTIGSFRKISKISAWLLAPYLIWVAYATVLNFEIWKMN